ncbi:hypothetical protein AMTR_s00030p00114770 [Amborella trichopoda]|uniref:Bulb-type lectin domain-containing protein n=1 Tax=Amborella trichopoda TaxID=13333 RepID=U5D1F6_AMBTC|nr:hypothetical protein AMTR_s00030p00114770 [Amborella trichopoda]
MAPPLYLLLLQLLATLSLSSAQTESPTGTQIGLGFSLSTTQIGHNKSFWLSPSGSFSFFFYPLSDPQNFIVGIWMPKTPEKTLVWSANRDSPPLSNGSSIILASNGVLLLRNSEAQEKPISDNPEPASSAALLDNGNLVLHNSQSMTIWQSFDSPTDTILSGQVLLPG